jgi:hypothetical protein
MAAPSAGLIGGLIGCDEITYPPVPAQNARSTRHFCGDTPSKGPKM